jgi:hypothetical protein
MRCHFSLFKKTKILNFCWLTIAGESYWTVNFRRLTIADGSYGRNFHRPGGGPMKVTVVTSGRQMLPIPGVFASATWCQRKLANF